MPIWFVSYTFLYGIVGQQIDVFATYGRHGSVFCRFFYIYLCRSLISLTVIVLKTQINLPVKLEILPHQV